MSRDIPFRDKGHNPLSQVIQVGEVANTKPLALEDTEPLLDDERCRFDRILPLPLSETGSEA